MYKIIRYFRDERKRNRVIKTGLTLEEAQKHCSDESTHKKDRKGDVIWFDGFVKE